MQAGKNQPGELVKQLSPPISTEAAFFCHTNFPQPSSLTPELETLLSDAFWRRVPQPWLFLLLLGKTKALPFLLL